MAKRLKDTEVWRKKWFRVLPPKYKCFWFYVLDCCDLIGKWSVDFEQASFMIGEEINEQEASEIFKNQILILEDNKWFIEEFCYFQYGLVLNEKSPIHKKIKDLLLLHKYKDNTLFDRVYTRVLIPCKEKDKENIIIEEDKENKKGDKFPFFWDKFHQATRQPKTDRDAALKYWMKLTNNEIELAIEKIDQYAKCNPEYPKKARTYLDDKNFNDEFVEKSQFPNHYSQKFEKSLDGQPQKLQEYWRYLRGLGWTTSTPQCGGTQWKPPKQ